MMMMMMMVMMIAVKPLLAIRDRLRSAVQTMSSKALKVCMYVYVCMYVNGLKWSFTFPQCMYVCMYVCRLLWQSIDTRSIIIKVGTCLPTMNTRQLSRYVCTYVGGYVCRLENFDFGL